MTVELKIENCCWDDFEGKIVLLLGAIICDPWIYFSSRSVKIRVILHCTWSRENEFSNQSFWIVPFPRSVLLRTCHCFFLPRLFRVTLVSLCRIAVSLLWQLPSAFGWLFCSRHRTNWNMSLALEIRLEHIPIVPCEFATRQKAFCLGRHLSEAKHCIANVEASMGRKRG